MDLRQCLVAEHRTRRVNGIDGYPVCVMIPVAWGEMDSFGHVNNIVYFRYFENARIAYFERVGFQQEYRQTGIGPILAKTDCRFIAPLTYPDDVVVGARSRDLGEDRFTMDYSIVSTALGNEAASGSGRIISYDYGRLAKAPLPDSVRRAIIELEGLGS